MTNDVRFTFSVGDTTHARQIELVTLDTILSVELEGPYHVIYKLCDGSRLEKLT